MKKRKIGIFSILFLALFAVFWVMLLSGNIMWTSNTPPLEVIDDMDSQPKVKPQSETTFFPDGRTMRDPVEGTVPRYGSQYAVASVEEAETQNVNTVPKTEFVLARGKNRFEALCSPCHSMDAKGNGMVVQKGFPPPPNLLRSETKALTDAHIYHIISAGQNIMPSYADKLPSVDRWAVIYYLRTLQGVEGQNQAAQTTDTATH